MQKADFIVKIPPSLFFLIWSLACSEQGSRENTKDASPGETAPAIHALAFFGGNSSCFDERRLPVGPKEQSLRKVFGPAKTAADARNQKNGAKTPFLITCYFMDNEQLSYALSRSDDPDAKTIQRTTLEEISDAWNEQLKALGQPVKLTLVGHSWGGWTAMKFATYLEPSVEIAGLVTLDPIDRENCGPVEVSASLTGLGGDACQRAPVHVTKGSDLKFAPNGKWINFYQTKFAPLHSGPIPAASLNVEKTFNVSVLDPSYHIDFLKDQEVIETVVKVVEGS